MKCLNTLLLGLGLMALEALLISAPVSAAEPEGKKVAPRGYPPGFKAAKQAAEARR